MAFDVFKRSAPGAGRAKGTNGAMGSSDPSPTQTAGADDEAEGKLIVQRRHVDWLENQIRWRWLLDSHEGGQRYRNAVYGPDRRGLPLRNLMRHRREYPDPQQFPNFYSGFAGALATIDANSMATQFGPYPGQLGGDPFAVGADDDDYEMRRARTPIPEFVAEAVETHLAKVYTDEVSRDGPADLVAWWEDVDGRGTPIDDYMRETIAPLLLVFGCIDVVLDHPQAPPGAVIKTRADELELGLDKIVASFIIPQNMVWARLDSAGRYVECLVREYVDAADRMDHDPKGNVIDTEAHGGLGQEWRQNYVRWRLWRSHESIVFNFDGSKILDRVPHKFGRVPIVRLIDLKKHRTEWVGKSRYEAIAEYQRAFYNLDSELILSDSLQAHPLLCGPEDYCKADNTISIGPNYLVPMKKNPETGAYQSFEYISPPKDPAESLRKDKDDLISLKDRRACLSQPAGAQSPGTVGQSGLSKVVDQHTGHKLLADIARSLSKAERALAEYALLTLRQKPVSPEDRKAIRATYPQRFQLMDSATLIDGITKLQLILGACGNAPNTERELIQQTIRELLIGLDDEEYQELDDEIEVLVQTKATIMERVQEMSPAGFRSAAAATEGAGSDEQAGGQDPTGQSAGTMVSGIIPAVM